VALQPQVPIRHAWPLLLLEQSLHVLPPTPHAVELAPPTQLPPEQQPPLHSCVDEQLVVHWWAVVSQALPSGQSETLEQPHLPATHPWPEELIEQSTHWVPEPPQTLPLVPATQEPFEQQAPLHGCVDEQEVVHWWLVVLQADPLGQSLDELHPQLPPEPPTTHAAPMLEPVQSWQLPPLAPQVGLLVPATQLPPEQQPPLHGCIDEHELVHLCVDPSHACPLGQSLAELQPHVPATQAFSEPIVQSVQAPPVLPHTPAALPMTQVPPLQQPPLHSCVDEHEVVHWCLDVSHAWPDGQSVAELQPHPPLTHAWPLPLIVQSAQDAPALPQVAAVPPALQVPLLQQPPLHSCVDEHEVVH
jgi:hypothetical protein